MSLSDEDRKAFAAELSKAIEETIIKPLVREIVRQVIQHVRAEQVKRTPPYWAPDWRKGKRK